MAAIVTDYTSFNAQLNRQIGADSDSEVAATIGRKLTIGGAWGEEMLSKSGAYVPAEIGAVMAHMTGYVGLARVHVCLARLAGYCSVWDGICGRAAVV